jgi:hypothetical protein
MFCLWTSASFVYTHGSESNCETRQIREKKAAEVGLLKRMAILSFASFARFAVPINESTMIHR